MYKYRSVGPNAALCLLSLWMNKAHALDRAEFEYLFDSILEFLEKLNDEQYRLDPPTEDLTDGQEGPL